VESDWERVVASGASLVWCPASNAFLFRRTAPVRRFLDASDRASAHVCLGSDSRVTGARDLLDELRRPPR
jgi:cytosine/adenosine deaminase-related metal-dependent hydrolase